jgi:hypothetical protein
VSATGDGTVGLVDLDEPIVLQRLLLLPLARNRALVHFLAAGHWDHPPGDWLLWINGSPPLQMRSAASRRAALSRCSRWMTESRDHMAPFLGASRERRDSLTPRSI